MALQTNVFRHGEWVTETVDLQDIIRGNTATPRPVRQRVAEPPTCGILTRTIIESPLAHWILPVRLRSEHHMDVAFIGDHFVQISELGRDGQLRDIKRKTDFGSRIRNAKVVGPPPEQSADDRDSDGATIKLEATTYDDDVTMGDMGYLGSEHSPPSTASPKPPLRKLPPQLLLIVLESGDCIFLFLQLGSSGRHEFVVSCHHHAEKRLVQPGYHAAVDPSSRYMALACASDVFVVYELDSMENVGQRYAQRQELRPIKTYRPRAVRGMIHKMEFLYPRPDDDYHIILLLIIVKNGQSRMVTYEWEAGDNLKPVLSEEKTGQLLPPQHQLPLLIIPLTIHSAFFSISPRHIGVCKDGLSFPAEFDDFAMEGHETSPFYHGRGVPLWTAWTRPYRLPTYSAVRDNIYLAREDGVVMFLDIDSDNILGASVEIGKFDCNISTSFCSLFDDFNDILIMGGESGPGTIWQIRPRQPNIQLGTIPNWSPVQDLTTSDEFTTWNGRLGNKSNGRSMLPWKDRSLGSFSKPDRIYATSGRGVTGAVTELRFGLRANIGLDVDYGAPIKQSWIFPVDSADGTTGIILLISLISTSAVLYLSDDLSQASELEEHAATYDLTSRTVATAQLPEGVVVQVTENNLVFVSPTQSIRRPHMEIFRESQITVVDAIIRENLIAVSTSIASRFQIHVLKIGPGGLVDIVGTFDPPGDVTSLCLADFQDSVCILAGISQNNNPSLAMYRISEDALSVPLPSLLIELNSDEISKLREPYRSAQVACPSLELISSIVALPPDGTATPLVLGTRGGDVTIIILDGLGHVSAVHTEKFGLTAAHASLVARDGQKKSVLVSCDGHLAFLSDFQLRHASFRSMHHVWVVDAADTSKPDPYVSSVCVLQNCLPGHDGKTQLVLTSQSRIMLAEVQFQAGPVNRSLPVGGTPSKILFSPLLDCLIVAVKDLEGKSTLKLIDPITGDDLSEATDKNGEPQRYASGLGKADDVIYCLNEWQYERGGDKWVFLLVSTKDGRLLVMSTAPRETRRDGSRGKIRYWTRHKRPPLNQPVYSVVGSRNNVFFCSGTTLYWEVLDLVEKRLKPQSSFELGSHASTLKIANDMVVALTDRDSIQVIYISGDSPGEMRLHHADSDSRSASSLIEVAGGTAANDEAVSMMLVCDRAYGLAGLWVPWQLPGRDCEVLFEAELPASVRKLVRGRVRPEWQQAHRTPRYGLFPSTLDGAEILGICIDGSLQHFTILTLPIWRILRLVQNLAFGSPVIYPFSFDEQGSDFDPEPEVDGSLGMQIDGDMLWRCLNRRALEGLFVKPAYAERLFEALDELDGGRWTATLAPENEATQQEGSRADMKKAKYLALLYDVLAYYLMPVL